MHWWKKDLALEHSLRPVELATWGSAAEINFRGNMGSIQWEDTVFDAKRRTPAMETGRERIAAKARCERTLRFTSLAHPLTRERLWENLIISRTVGPRRGRPDGNAGKEGGSRMDPPDAQAVHRQGISSAGYSARIYIPSWETGEAPLGVPCGPTGLFSAAPRKYCLPFTSRSFCRARLAGGPGAVPIMPWQH